MIRVAAIANILVDNCNKAVDKKSIITSCLLHDMGNIIKLDFEKPIAWLSVYDTDSEYRKEEQKRFIKKYGNDENIATIIIAKELTNNNFILKLIQNIWYSHIKKHIQWDDFSAKICCYADMRVMPNKVVSLETRMEDAFARYQGKKYRNTRKEFETSLDIVKKLEQQVMQHCTITPESIMHEAIEAQINNLRNFII